MRRERLRLLLVAGALLDQLRVAYQLRRAARFEAEHQRLLTVEAEHGWVL